MNSPEGIVPTQKVQSAEQEAVPTIPEVIEKTPEEIKEERRMGIIKEIEGEWEAKNGPMHRNLSEVEIEQNKGLAKAFGEEWNGRTTQLTERASEFFFDHRGMGKSSVPDFRSMLQKQKSQRLLNKSNPT